MIHDCMKLETSMSMMMVGEATILITCGRHINIVSRLDLSSHLNLSSLSLHTSRLSPCWFCVSLWRRRFYNFQSSRTTLVFLSFYVFVSFMSDKYLKPLESERLDFFHKEKYFVQSLNSHTKLGSFSQWNVVSWRDDVDLLDFILFYENQNRQ